MRQRRILRHERRLYWRLHGICRMQLLFRRADACHYRRLGGLSRHDIRE